MEALVASAVLVAIAEVGDRTQLVALTLAATHRKPAATLAGIALGALVNHVLAAVVGFYLANLFDAPWFHLLVAASFLLVGLWTLPQREPASDTPRRSASGAFAAAFVAILVTEMGDRTQLATAALAARFHDVAMVTLGSTFGLVAVSAPAVLVGGAITRRLPLKSLRVLAGGAYILVGIYGLAAWAAHPG